MKLRMSSRMAVKIFTETLFANFKPKLYTDLFGNSGVHFPQEITTYSKYDISTLRISRHFYVLYSGGAFQVSNVMQNNNTDRMVIQDAAMGMIRMLMKHDRRKRK